MSLSEEARLELMRMTLKFAADNFTFSQCGVEITRDIEECYLVLHGAISFDGGSRQLGEVRHPSPFRFCQGAFSSFGAKNKVVGVLKKLLTWRISPAFPQEASNSNNGCDPLKNVRTHSSSPNEVSKNPASDSSSEESKKSVAPFDLSGESLATLYQLAENAQNLKLLKAAALELNKRRGCDV